MPLPSRQGLYDPAFEHDACGLGFVATLRGEANHEIVKQGLEILENLTHRGAAECDPCTGDGASVLLRAVAAGLYPLPVGLFLRLG